MASKYSRVRHPFLYKVKLPDGSEVVRKKMARVIRAKQPVTIYLTKEHVKKSIRLHGIGNTAHCSGAICTYAHADSFPHPVVPWTDWTYARVFIGAKLDKNGLPSECYAYEHWDDIAKFNDSKNGQRKLLRLLERDGPMLLTLLPYRQRSTAGRSGRGRGVTGARRRGHPTGANLRWQYAMQAGALPR